MRDGWQGGGEGEVRGIAKEERGEGKGLRGRRRKVNS